MTKEETYNNMCVATMVNLQGFYREDKALYLGTIDRKNKVDRFLLTQAFFCSNINENCKIYVGMNVFNFWKLKKETKRDDLVRMSSIYKDLLYLLDKRKEEMLEFVQEAYGYNKEKDGFKVFEDIYDEFFNNKSQKKEKKKK